MKPRRVLYTSTGTVHDLDASDSQFQPRGSEDSRQFTSRPNLDRSESPMRFAQSG